MSPTTPAEYFEIGGTKIAPGTQKTVHLPISVLSDHTPITMSVHVVHGKLPGPTIFVSAAIHGDEVIGVEIVRRLLKTKGLKNLKGTLLAIPIVNAYGFLNHSRYLPDRRDLNRSFPGSAHGSLAGRLAHIFLNEIVARSSFGIDLHSAAIHRTNLPQIRVSESNPETMNLARIFGAPVIVTSMLREGSLRQTAEKMGIDVLVYEAGEGLRFDEKAVRAGVSGILKIMHHLNMLPRRSAASPKIKPLKSHKSAWLRAPAGGLVRVFKDCGEMVKVGDILGVVADPFGEVETEIVVEQAGLMIGRAVMPIVNEGDALFHIAQIDHGDVAVKRLESMTDELDQSPLFDEDEII